MSGRSIFETVSRVQRRSIGALIVLVVVVHVTLLVFEVKATANGLYGMILGQVSNFTSMNAQAGDLISLQQSLESLTSPIADSFPIEVRIVRMVDQKIIVATASKRFDASSWFLYNTETEFAAMPFGQMKMNAAFDYSNLVLSILTKATISLLLLIGGLVMAQAFILRETKENLVPIDQFSDWLNQLNPETVRRGEVEIPTAAKEHNLLTDALEKLFTQINSLAREIAGRESERKMAEVAAQVAHDIRSPLSALNMVATSLKELPEEKRLIIRNAAQRINDIANGLFRQSKKAPQSSAENTPGSSTSVASTTEPVMLVALLDAIISEKRVQFRERMEIEILGDLNQGYGLFARVNATEFARVVSNLVNNSVEAMSSGGHITVSIRVAKTSVSVIVSDNGKGIPPEVLAQLGERGITNGKAGTQSGSGLGIYHAKETVESVGGKLIIQSQIGAGTIITLTLPRGETPRWFVEKITLAPDTTVVSVDDDQTIHQIWAERLASVAGATSAIQHLTFSSIDQFEAWPKTSRPETGFYLVDYEFLGQSGNGLDLIERAGLAPNAILVTSRYEEPQVRARAEALGVPIIPKTLAPFVPLVIEKPRHK